MAIEDAANGIGDRLVHIVAIHEYRVKGGDRTALRPAGALEQTGQQRENGRRVAAAAGRLAHRQADLPLRHREPCDRVHHEKHLFPSVAKMLRDGGREHGRPEPDQRRLIGRGADDDRTLQPLHTEILFDEFAQLAATLTDQRDDVHVALCAARHHPEQRRFTHAAARENTDALTKPHRGEGVDRTHARGHRLADALPAEGVRRSAVQGRTPLADQRAEPVHRLPESVDRAAEQAEPDRGRGGKGRGENLAAGTEIVRLAERHEEESLIAKADDLRMNRRIAAPRVNLTPHRARGSVLRIQ